MKKDKLSQLAAMMDKVVQDDPHEAKKTATKKASVKKKGTAAKKTVTPKKGPTKPPAKTTETLDSNSEGEGTSPNTTPEPPKTEVDAQRPATREGEGTPVAPATPSQPTEPAPVETEPASVAKPRSKKRAKSKDTRPRERTAVNLTATAIDSLKQIQAFLITDCDAKSVSTSGAMCIALETTAALLKDRKHEIASRYEDLKRTDRRRKEVS